MQHAHLAESWRRCTVHKQTSSYSRVISSALFAEGALAEISSQACNLCREIPIRHHTDDISVVRFPAFRRAPQTCGRSHKQRRCAIAAPSELFCLSFINVINQTVSQVANACSCSCSCSFSQARQDGLTYSLRHKPYSCYCHKFCVNSLATAFQHDHAPPSHWAEIALVTHHEPTSRGQCPGCALESDRSGT